MNFCHLHVHNEYSILDGFGKAQQYAARLAQLGHKFCALTNHGNVNGAIQWQKALSEVGITPIFGCELYIVQDAAVKQKGDVRKHITALVENEEGWRNLLKMLSYANIEGFYYRPRVDVKTFEGHMGGLVFLSGCADSLLLTSWGLDVVSKLYHNKQIYFEVMPFCTEQQKTINKFCIDNCDNDMLVATNDVHYIMKEDAEVHDVMLAIQTKDKMSSKSRWTFGDGELYLKSDYEMMKGFKEQGVLNRAQYLNAIQQTVQIAERCKQFKILRVPVTLPRIPQVDEGRDEFAFLRNIVYPKLNILLKKIPEDKKWEYGERLEEELEAIKKAGFTRYFLIVWELIQWCNNEGIMVGPGRGSAGGSLVVYLLGITQVDPIKHGLLFFRFISPDRIDLPDIDLDFEDTKRELVRKHLIDLYGEHNVAYISTVQEMHGRSAIRDVGRVFDLPAKDVDEFAKSIDKGLTDSTNTEAAAQFATDHPTPYKIALRLEGQLRSSGTHAAACVVSNEDLTLGNKGVLLNAKNNELAINWDKDDAEFMGLMKLDLLGLKELSVLNRARKLIIEKESKTFEYTDIPLDIPYVLHEFAQGNTVGCFQFGSDGIRKLCRDVGVSNFEDIVAINALYRPGTMRSGMFRQYVDGKHGVAIPKIHPKFDEITKSTFGVVVYQEQLMNVTHYVAGLDWATTDKLRKVVAKSKGAAEFNKFKDMFVAGCYKTSGIDENTAANYFDKLAAFAGYGFNRSHSVQYSIIAYWGMWLKVTHPAEFIAASLTFGSDSKTGVLVDEAIRLGLKLKLPKYGVSDSFNWVAKDNYLYCPFIEVKGIGTSGAQKIKDSTIESKKPKRFFTSGTVDLQKVLGAKMFDLLVKIGAFTDYEATVADLENIKDLFDFKFSSGSTPEKAIVRLFEGADDKTQTKLLAELPDITNGEFGGLKFKLGKRAVYQNKELINCTACVLRKGCNAPVLPSKGLYNVMLLGESPWKDEDREGKGFVGKTGKEILWPALQKHNLQRNMFHVTNTVKCAPFAQKLDSKVALPCQKWLTEEIQQLKPCLIMAFGKISLSFFEGEEGSMLHWNGRTKWYDKWNCWVVFCIHPSYVIYKGGKSQDFDDAIQKFVDLMKTLTGIIF